MTVIAGHTPAKTQRALRGLPDGGIEYRDSLEGNELVPTACLAIRSVTHAEYSRCVQARVCSPVACAGADAASAVECATFEQANAYCESLGARLQRHNEWQLAVFGQTRRRFPWGDAPLPSGHREYVTPDGIANIGAADEWVESDHAAFPRAYRFFALTTSSKAAPFTSELGSNAPAGAAIRCALSLTAAQATNPTTR